MAATAVLLNPKAPEFQMPPSLPFNPNAPEFKPVESTLTLRPEAAEFIPMAGGWATLQAAAEAYQNKQKRQMPFATDEEWEQRIQKREKEVETIKSLQSYRLYIEVFPHDKRGDDDPKTPDPRDRTVSKRMWKWNVEKWRLQLKSRCVYSRGVLLQCREELRRRGDVPFPDSPTGAAEPAGGASPAAANQTAGSVEDDAAKAAAEPRWKTVSINEQPRTIPSGSRRPKDGAGEAGYKAASPASPGANKVQVQ